MSFLFVALGAAVGAPLRYLMDRFVQSRHDSPFPWGTLAVNVFGSLVLGLLAGATTAVYALLGTGFCGALTTYSTFGFETVRLAERRLPLHAMANMAVSIAVGLAAAYLGYTFHP